MSYSAAIDQIRVAIDAIGGMHIFPQTRSVSLETSGYEQFDGAFVVSSIGGPLPIEEIYPTPEAFRSRVSVKWGTLIKDSREAADDLAVQRGIDITQALLTAARPGTDCINIEPDGEPDIYTLDEMRLIGQIPFRLLYLEV